MSVCPAKTQISLGICPVWSEFLLWAQWVAKDPSFLHADSDDWSDWVDAQADLSLRWVHSHCVGFVMLRLKFEQCGFTINYKWCRRSGKQCRPWTDCSFCLILVYTVLPRPVCCLSKNILLFWYSSLYLFSNPTMFPVTWHLSNSVNVSCHIVQSHIVH